MLQYDKKHLGHNNFKYDHIISKWIDVDCIDSTIAMSYNAPNEVYTVDRIDAEDLEKFVTERNV